MSSSGLVPQDDPPITDRSSLGAERRLWFDFVSRLNERNLEASTRSGATNWVLFGVVVAIVYRCVPRIPSFLSNPEYISATRTIFFLELNAAFAFGSLLVGLVLYSVGLSEKRLKPERARRANQTFVYVFGFAWGSLAVAQVWSGFKIVGFRFVKWTLIGFGLFWFVNIVAGIVKPIRKHGKEKERKVRLPEFYGFNIGGDLGHLLLVAFSVPLLILPGSALIVFLSSLSRTAGWVLPLSAATQALVLCVIAMILLSRALNIGEQSAYAALERAIVVENLDPSEIRTRYVTQLLGPEVGEWLKSISSGMTEANEQLRRTTRAFNDRLAEIQAIDSQYSLERSGRAERLAKELSIASREHQDAMAKFSAQLLEYARFIFPKEETDLLKAVVSQLEASVEESSTHAVLVNSALEKLQPYRLKE
jgi:hypothetical protein